MTQENWLGGAVTAGDALTVKVGHPAVADGDLEECAGAGSQVAAARGGSFGGNRCLHALV